jgi:hypothetical protein
MMTKQAKQRELDYRAEDDHRTLTRAAEIAGDSDRMKGVAKHHRKTQKGLSRVGRMIGGKR